MYGAGPQMQMAGYPGAGAMPGFDQFGGQHYGQVSAHYQVPMPYAQGYPAAAGRGGGMGGYSAEDMGAHMAQMAGAQAPHAGLQGGYGRGADAGGGCGPPVAGDAARMGGGFPGYGMNAGGMRNGIGAYGGYGASSPDEGEDYEGPRFWRQEYSVGTVPEYQAEALWRTGDDDDELAEVNVFGPSGDQVPPAITDFGAAAEVFPHQIVQRLQYAGFTAPTPIQAHTWAIAVAGRDLIGIAKTGSGKTLAFLLPGFLRVLQARVRPPHLCVLAPTRELACQIEAEAEKFGRAAGIKTACCYGGAPRGEQLGQIRRGAQVVVACPGRLNDFIQSGAIHLGNVGYLVLDEADRMLDMGFEPQIRQVIAKLPEGRQTLLFTATWPREVRSLASEFLVRPIHVQTGAADVLTVNKDIEQHVIFVANEEEKATQLIQLLQGLSHGDRCLIFCEMKRSAEVLASQLINYYGISAARIHGDMAQYERTRALESFKSGQYPIMVATDVAARGIDVKGITVVINFDASGSAKDYVHRIGRTGRAGQKGLAYSFLMPREEKKAQDIINVLQRSNLPVPEELQSRIQQKRPPRSGGGKGGKGKGGKGKGGKGKGGGRSGKGKGGGGGGACAFPGGGGAGRQPYGGGGATGE